MGRVRKDAHFVEVEYGKECNIDTSDYNLELIYNDDYFDKENAKYTQFFTNLLFKKSYSMATLAKLSGIDASTLHKLFRNKRKWNVEYIKRVCNAFGVVHKIEDYEMPHEKKTIIQTANELAEVYSSFSRYRNTGDKGRYKQICQAFCISEASLKRYLRVASLDEQLQMHIDNCHISFLAGVELSYLKKSSQLKLAEFISNTGSTISRQQAVKLRKYDIAKKKALSYENIMKIVMKEKKTK